MTDPEYSLERLTDSAFILVGTIEETIEKHLWHRMRERRWAGALKVVVHTEQLLAELRGRVIALQEQFGEAGE